MSAVVLRSAVIVAGAYGLLQLLRYRRRARLRAFVEELPKCELHVHIEGTIEPETMLHCATRNGMLGDICNEGESPEAAARRISKERASFTDLQHFLRLYNEASKVLRTRADFYNVMTAYIARCKTDNVRYAEVFFDPQSHLQRGVPAEAIIGGLVAAIRMEGLPGKPDGCAAAHRPFKARLIMCFLRDWRVDARDERVPADPAFSGFPSAMEALAAMEGHARHIIAVGLDNAEMWAEPQLFREVYLAAKVIGIPHAVAHAGEEGPPRPYISDAIDVLGVERIDHGVQVVFDAPLMRQCAEKRIPLTVCPLSNERLQVYSRFFRGRKDVVRRLLEARVPVTLNSDDPAYFGGGMTDNFMAAAEASSLTAEELVEVSRCAFCSSFAPEEEVAMYLSELKDYARGHGISLAY